MPDAGKWYVDLFKEDYLRLYQRGLTQLAE